MIAYNDILQKLKSAGYNTTRIRKENILPQSTLQRLREGKPITTETIDILCQLLNCQPGDILEYVPDNEESEV